MYIIKVSSSSDKRLKGGVIEKVWLFVRLLELFGANCVMFVPLGDSVKKHWRLSLQTGN